jgi:hypothetical protein
VEGYGPMIPWQPVVNFGLKQGANSIPIHLGKDKSDKSSYNTSTYFKAHLTCRMSFFIFTYFPKVCADKNAPPKISSHFLITFL